MTVEIRTGRPLPGMPPFHASLAVTSAGIAVVRVCGDVDIATVDHFRGILETAIAASDGDVHLDLRDLGCPSAAMLSELVETDNRLAKAGRALRLHSAPPTLVRMLKITHLDRFLDDASGPSMGWPQ